jgi:hypothetical protein
MKLSRTLGGCCNLVYGKEFPMNSVILQLDNGMELVCTNFCQSRKLPLHVYCYIPTEKKWVLTILDGEYKEIMWKYYRKCKRKHEKCKANYSQMMKHERKHKNGGGGSRIGSNAMVTDYECTKETMHDFRRSMYVQWN